MIQPRPFAKLNEVLLLLDANTCAKKVCESRTHRRRHVWLDDRGPPGPGARRGDDHDHYFLMTQATTTTDFGPLPATARWDSCTQLALDSVGGLAADSVGASTLGSSTTWSIVLQRDHLPTNKLEPPCLPTAYISAVMAGRNPVYSPGTGCPAGYVPMCTSVATGVAVPAATNIQVWSALASGEIAVGCCPRYVFFFF